MTARETELAMYKLIGLIIMLCFFACSSDKTDISKQQAQEPGDVISQTSQAGSSVAGGSYSLEILPVNATKASRLYAVPHGFNLSDARVEWLVNGAQIQSPKVTEFDASVTKKTDTIQIKAMIQGKEIVSNVVQIGNAPPEISRIKIMPEVFKTGDTLSVDAAGKDVDGDEVTLSYEWTKNGEPAGNDRQIQVPLRRGDKISVKITPFDGTDYGRSGILHREIVNLPPMITDQRKYLFDGKRFSQQINATDPDGDILTYSLKKSPPGMKIDSSSGAITWEVPSDFIGTASFTVSVADGHGGEVTQDLTLNIKAEQKK
jgi:hypothetical protein